MQVISLTEQVYRYHTFMTAIEVLEDLTPTYQKSNQRVAAVTMFRMGTEVPQICEQLDMKESDVYEAVASYKRSREEMEERQEE